MSFDIFLLKFGKNDLLWLLLVPLNILSPRRFRLPPVGRFNAGQKLHGAFVVLAVVLFSITGVLIMYRPAALTNDALFERDGWSCAYCGRGMSELRRRGVRLTRDHVVPVSRGGSDSWRNVVTACEPCNLRKGGRTPLEAHMPPRRHPRRPTAHQLQALGRRFPPHYLHESWLDYLYWDIELEA